MVSRVLWAVDWLNVFFFFFCDFGVIFYHTLGSFNVFFSFWCACGWVLVDFW